MVHIAVVVTTYRRPEGLAKLLKALQLQCFTSHEYHFKLSIIVVDNDSKGSGRQILDSFTSTELISFQYVIEPTQGIPFARNTGIDTVPDDAEFFCFIDDDEWPKPNWIEALLKTQRATSADCVLGAVIPIYPSDAPKWIVRTRVFDSWNFRDQQLLKEAASNNVLISTKFVRGTGLCFEKRMRMTGGSDYLFFKQAVAMGMRIVWSAGAPVYEDIPLSRMKISWLVQRQYRLGNTFSVSERIAGTKMGLFKWVCKGSARIVLGIMMLPLLLCSRYYGMRAFVHILRGVGTVAGVYGHIHEEYSLQGLAKDRTSSSVGSS